MHFVVLLIDELDALLEANRQYFILQLHAEPLVSVDVTLSHVQEELVKLIKCVILVVFDPL